MSKYIDENKVLEYIIFGVVGKNITCGELTRAIESIPTIDIVRCKECKFADSYKTLSGEWRYYCGESGVGGREKDDFCSYGERKDNEWESENKCHRHGISLEDGTPIYECIGCDKQDCERIEE